MVNATMDDNGLYSCTGYNVAGQLDSTDNFLLNIRGKHHVKWLLLNWFHQFYQIRHMLGFCGHSDEFSKIEDCARSLSFMCECFGPVVGF